MLASAMVLLMCSVLGRHPLSTLAFWNLADG